MNISYQNKFFKPTRSDIDNDIEFICHVDGNDFWYSKKTQYFWRCNGERSAKNCSRRAVINKDFDSYSQHLLPMYQAALSVLEDPSIV